MHQSFPPVIDSNAKVLILGSMPGMDSLRQQQYYAFKHNVFWRIMGELFAFEITQPYPERLKALQRARIGLWDTLAYCERKGSLDTHIQHPQPNAIPQLLELYPQIQKICCNGTSSGKYLKKFFPHLNIEIEVLPSTSPAAAIYTYQQKLTAWKKALQEHLSVINEK